MGRKTIDRNKQGVKINDKQEEVQMSTLASKHTGKFILIHFPYPVSRLPVEDLLQVYSGHTLTPAVAAEHLSKSQPSTSIKRAVMYPCQKSQEDPASSPRRSPLFSQSSFHRKDP